MMLIGAVLASSCSIKIEEKEKSVQRGPSCRRRRPLACAQKEGSKRTLEGVTPSGRPSGSARARAAGGGSPDRTSRP